MKKPFDVFGQNGLHNRAKELEFYIAFEWLKIIGLPILVTAQSHVEVPCSIVIAF